MMRNAQLSAPVKSRRLKHWGLLLGMGLLITTGTLTLTQMGVFQNGLEESWRSLKTQFSPPNPAAHPYPFETLLRGDRSSTTAVQGAIAHYQQQTRHNPNSGMDQAALSSAYLRMGRITGQSNWYLLANRAAQQSLAKLSFNNSEALTVLARVAEARHDFDGALKLAAQIPNPREALAIQTTSNLAMGKLSTAHEAAAELVSQTLSQSAYTLLALVQTAQGQDADALNSFGYALQAEEPGEFTSSARTRILLGRFRYERGQLEQAEALYREALRIAPDSAQAWLNLAQLEIRRGDLGAAERYYRRVADWAEGNPTVYTPLVLRGQARIQALRGNRSAAEALWQEAEIQLRQGFSSPQDFSFGHRRDLARVLLERGNPADVSQAIALMQAEVQHRRDADTLDTYVWALMSAQRWQEARTVVQEAIALGTRDAALFNRAGTIEQALHNSAQAQRYFQQVQAIDPQFDQQAEQASYLGAGLGS